MRLIDAGALKKKAQMRGYVLKKSMVTVYHMCVSTHDINEAPTVDAEPVRHGRWIDQYDGKYANPHYICSNCKGEALYTFKGDILGSWKAVQELSKYCPNCGAKMDEEV